MANSTFDSLVNKQKLRHGEMNTHSIESFSIWYQFISIRYHVIPLVISLFLFGTRSFLLGISIFLLGTSLIFKWM
jgi:hypothetical protein